MAKKKIAAPTAGAVAVAEAARDNPYVQRIIDDDGLREDLRTAFDSARRAYERIDGKSPQKALQDKRVQKDLKQTAASLQSAAESFRKVPQRRKKKRKGTLLLLALVAGGAAVAANEGLRGKLLDALFGSEEEFQYSAPEGS
jgi:hypothetical protein